MENERIREKARNHGVRLWQLADRLGISEASLTRLLRHEVDRKMAERLTNAIDEIVEHRKENSL